MEVAGRLIAAQAGLAVAGAAYYYSRSNDDSKPRINSPDKLTVRPVLNAAGSIVKAARAYGFVCTSGGRGVAPECRVMDLHRLAGDTLEFGLVSRSFTRKAASLHACNQCTIAFHDPRCSGEAGYLTLSGTARELTVPEEREAIWKPSWSFFHPSPASTQVVQWHFVPSRLEMVSHVHGVSDEWTAVTATRDALDPKAPWVLQERRTERIAREQTIKT